jgi:hypothetical protein
MNRIEFTGVLYFPCSRVNQAGSHRQARGGREIHASLRDVQPQNRKDHAGRNACADPERLRPQPERLRHRADQIDAVARHQSQHGACAQDEH